MSIKGLELVRHPRRRPRSIRAGCSGRPIPGTCCQYQPGRFGRLDQPAELRGGRPLRQRPGCWPPSQLSRSFGIGGFTMIGKLAAALYRARSPTGLRRCSSRHTITSYTGSHMASGGTINATQPLAEQSREAATCNGVEPPALSAQQRSPTGLAASSARPALTARLSAIGFSPPPDWTIPVPRSAPGRRPLQGGPLHRAIRCKAPDRGRLRCDDDKRFLHRRPTVTLDLQGPPIYNLAYKTFAGADALARVRPAGR